MKGRHLNEDAKPDSNRHQHIFNLDFAVVEHFMGPRTSTRTSHNNNHGKKMHKVSNKV